MTASESTAVLVGDQAPATSMRSLVVRSTSWTLLAYAAGIAMRFGTNLLLAHLLFPSAFALTALASVLAQGLKMFSDIGIGPSIVRSHRGDDPGYLNTAWTIQVLRGFVLFAVSCVGAWPMAMIYGDRNLLWVVPVSSFTLVIAGFGSTSLFTLSRELRMGKIMSLNLIERIAQTMVTVAWALVSPSVGAILAGLLVSRVLFVALSHSWLGGVRNRFCWDREAATDLLRFGRWIFVSTAIAFLAGQIDRVILGRLATLDVLGVYSVALTLAGIPYELGTRLTEGVLFPALSSIARSNREGLHAAVLKARAVILSGALLATLGVMLVGPWFFRFLYDARYSEAEWMAPIAAGSIWVAILQTSADRALLAVGDSRALALSGATNLVATIAFTWIGYLTFGLVGFVVGVGIGNAAGHVVVQLAMRRHTLAVHVQDFRYTGLLALLVLSDFAIRFWIRRHRPDLPDWHGALIVGAPIMAGVTLWSVRRVLGQLVKR